MTVLRRLPASLLLAPLLLLGGCLDIRQDVWVNPDGTGRLRIDMGLERALIEQDPQSNQEQVSGEMGESFKEAARTIHDDPRVQSVRVEEFLDEGYLRAAIDVALHDWRDLPAINEQVLRRSDSDRALDELLLFSLEEREDGTILFAQPLSQAGPEPEPGDDATGSALVRRLGRAIFEDGALTVVLHSPTVSRTNGVWQMDRQSVQWKTDLADLLSRPMPAGEHTAEIGPSARSWHFWRIVGIIMAVSALVWVLAWFRRRRRDGSAPEPI